jgi:hypothetical protein
MQKLLSFQLIFIFSRKFYQKEYYKVSCYREIYLNENDKIHKSVFYCRAYFKIKPL